jgi:hypothetical protein
MVAENTVAAELVNKHKYWIVQHEAEKRAIIKIILTLYLQKCKKNILSKIYNKAYYFLNTTSSRWPPPLLRF